MASDARGPLPVILWRYADGSIAGDASLMAQPEDGAVQVPAVLGITVAEAAALRELADAAARRIALRQAVAMPERVTAGEAFAAEGVPPGDMLGDREWLREYRAARALRGGDGHGG